jgi:hypothetical protein
VLKYCLAVDLLKELPFRFDTFLRKFMKILSPSEISTNYKHDVIYNSIRQLEKYIENNGKVFILNKFII